MATVAKNDGSKWADKQMFTTGEAAEVCRVSQQTIIRCFDKGRLQGFRVPGSRFRKIPRTELLRFMHANDIATEVLEAATQRVLIVDDNEEIVDRIRKLLNDDGRFEVHSASTSYDAGIMTERVKPHLILLDLRMPELNGNLVCRRIRTNSELANTKVLVLSPSINDRDLARLTANGADGFVSKPLEPKTLVGRIEKVLGL